MLFRESSQRTLFERTACESEVHAEQDKNQADEALVRLHDISCARKLVFQMKTIRFRIVSSGQHLYVFSLMKLEARRAKEEKIMEQSNLQAHFRLLA